MVPVASQTALNEAKTEAEKEEARRKLKRLEEEQRQMLADADELKQRMEAQGVELKFTPAEEFGRMVEQEFRTWGKAVEMAKVKLE